MANRHRRRVLWSCAALALGSVVSWWVHRAVAPHATTTPLVAAFDLHVGSDSSPERVDTQAIVDHSLFCRGCRGDLREEARPTLPVAELPLTLLATLESDDPSQSWASIAKVGEGAAAYANGELIMEGVLLHRVHRGEVWVMNRGQLQRLTLLSSAPREVTSRVVPPDVTSSELPFDCRVTTPCVLGKAWVADALKDPAALAKSARLAPTRGPEGLRGYRVFGIKPGGLADHLGFRNADLITSINGQPLDDLDAMMKLYADLRAGGSWTVELERRGQPLVQRYSIQ